MKSLGSNKLATIAAILVLLLVVVSAAAPWVAPYPPEETFFDGLTIEGAPLPPNGKFWLGTDLLGRDLLSSLLLVSY